MVKIKNKTFVRSLALLLGGIGYLGLFGTDLNLGISGQGIQRRLNLSRSAARDLAQNQDMVVGVRGPYEHGIRSLYEMKASAIKKAEKSKSSFFRRQATKNNKDDEANPFLLPYISEIVSTSQQQERQSEGPIQTIRKGLRKMMGGHNTPIDRDHRNLRRKDLDLNLTFDLDNKFNVTFNNITNETTLESCWFTPTLDPDRVKEITDQKQFTNTIVVGYPGPDKRTVLRQMEAMTGLSGRDAWDFQFLGMTSQPFIKTNYPHHEGIWGWQDHGDQVVLVLRNPRRSIDEYHDILADIHYAKTWEEATEKIPDLFQGIIEADKYAMWRNERTMDEIGWYGWLIDYWMEDGLMRDYFDHKVTTPEHFALLREPETYTYGELQWDVNVCTDAVSFLICATAITHACV